MHCDYAGLRRREGGSALQFFTIYMTFNLQISSSVTCMILGSHSKKSMRSKKPASLSECTSISSQQLELILEKLKSNKNRKSTVNNYHQIWKQFNEFVLKLDVKSNSVLILWIKAINLVPLGPTYQPLKMF